MNQEEGLRQGALIIGQKRDASVQKPSVTLCAMSIRVPMALISHVKERVVGKGGGFSTSVWFYSLGSTLKLWEFWFCLLLRRDPMKTGRMREKITRHLSCWKAGDNSQEKAQL